MTAVRMMTDEEKQRFDAAAGFADFVTSAAVDRQFDNGQIIDTIAILIVDAAIGYAEHAKIDLPHALMATIEDVARRCAHLTNHLTQAQNES